MPVTLNTPAAGELDGVLRALGGWQHEGGPVQLHPGDVGWHWRFGAQATARALRTWSRGGEMLAVGLLDGADLLRLAIAPEAEDDGDLAARIAADVADPARGVLPSGSVCVEVRGGRSLRGRLLENGWVSDEPWTPLRRILGEPVAGSAVPVEVIGPDRADVRAAVQRAAFDNSTFTVEGWHLMAAGPAYAAARCLVARDEQGVAVAAATVWSAGPGRPGLLEPVGVHRRHRGRGYGRAITLAAAAALRDLGASSAVVCTPSSNAGAVATYRSAGFRQLPDVRDLRLIRSPGEPAAA